MQIQIPLIIQIQIPCPGKIYGGLLILENWKTSRFGARLPPPGAKVGESKTTNSLSLSTKYLLLIDLAHAHPISLLKYL